MTPNSYQTEIQRIVVTIEPKNNGSGLRNELRKIEVQVVLRNSMADSKSFSIEDPIPLGTILANISEVVNSLVAEGLER